MNINPKTQQAYQLLHNGVLAFARAEQAGIRVDVDYAEKKKQYLTRKIDHLDKKLKETKFFRHWQDSSKGKVNINSDTQLRGFLYGVKGLEPPNLTVTGQGSTDEDSLLQLNIPELNDLLQIRKLKKVRDTYLDAFIREQVNGYMHPSFNLNLVKTFRSSSDHPNFQNIPIRDVEAMQICRKALYPRPGHQLLEIDYSGLEVRIAACYHKDSTMLKYINNPASDMHSDMAEQIFMVKKLDHKIPSHEKLRDAAKNGFVFPEFYGDWYKQCAINLACHWGQLSQGRWREGQGVDMPIGKLSDHLIAEGIKSFDKFTNHVKEIEHDFWSNRFREYAEWKDRWWAVYQKHGHVDLLTGFRCSGVMSKNDVINYPVQGAAFHCLLWSFIESDQVMRNERWDSKLIGQIHDSIIFDVNPKELNHVATVVKQITCEDLPKAWDWIITPLDVKMSLSPVDKSLADMEKFVLN